MTPSIARARRVVVALGVIILAGACGKQDAEPDLVIDGVTVIDGTGAAPNADRSVAVKDGRILSIGAAGSVSGGRNTRRVDGRGNFLVPGLWDMHVHLTGYGEHAFPLFVANGVTAVRDVGGHLPTLLALREAVRSGRMQGPELLIAGPILDSPYLIRAVKGTPYERGREAIADSASAVRWADSLARAGVDHLKVHSMTPRAAYFALLAAAKRHGLQVVGHVPDSVTPREAVEAGQRTIEHTWRLDLATSSRADAIDRWQLAASARVVNESQDRPNFGGPLVVRMAAMDSGLATFDPKVANDFAGWAATRDVWFDPTLVVMKAFLGMKGVGDSTELRYAPREARLEESMPSTATDEELEREFLAMRAPVEALIRGGVKIVTGTDVPVMPLVPGFSLHHELGLLVDAGLTPVQAIQAATRNSALAAGRGADMGTIEVGKRADLVLLDADPLADIANTRRVLTVVLRGKLLDRAALDRMLTDAEAYARDH